MITPTLNELYEMTSCAKLYCVESSNETEIQNVIFVKPLFAHREIVFEIPVVYSLINSKDRTGIYDINSVLKVIVSKKSEEITFYKLIPNYKSNDVKVINKNNFMKILTKTAIKLNVI